MAPRPAGEIKTRADGSPCRPRRPSNSCFPLSLSSSGVSNTLLRVSCYPQSRSQLGRGWKNKVTTYLPYLPETLNSRRLLSAINESPSYLPRQIRIRSNKQRFASYVNKPPLYLFSFELPLLMYSLSRQEREREGNAHLRSTTDTFPASHTTASLLLIPVSLSLPSATGQKTAPLMYVKTITDDQVPKWYSTISSPNSRSRDFSLHLGSPSLGRTPSRAFSRSPTHSPLLVPQDARHSLRIFPIVYSIWFVCSRVPPSFPLTNPV